MKCSQIQNNNVNFGAVLDVGKYMERKARWVNIAKLFEEKTSKYSDNLYINTYTNINNPNDKITEILALSKSKKGRQYQHAAEIKIEDLNKLLKKSDEQVVNKLLKLLKIFKRQDSQCDKVLDKLGLIKVKGKIVGRKHLGAEAHDAFIKESIKNTEIAKNKDNILKNFKFYYDFPPM